MLRCGRQRRSSGWRVTNDFSISANPTSVSVAQGAAGTSTISTAVTAGVSGTVGLAVTGPPSGATASLSPTSVSAGGSSTLTINAGTAAPGPYTLTITGTEGSTLHFATVSLTVTAAAGVPGAPVLTATTNNRRGVQLSWTVPANNGSAISAYRIYRWTSQGSETQLVQVGRTSTSYRDTSTTSGTTYYYEVTAVNGSGEGLRSNEVSAKAR